MRWIVRLLKVALIVAAWAVFGYLALVLVSAAVVLWLLLEGESAFWGGILGD